MPGLKRNEKITGENCGTQTTRRTIVRHQTRSLAGSFTCLSCTNFSTESRTEMSYYLTKKHSTATATIFHKCKECDKDLHSF